MTAPYSPDQPLTHTATDEQIMQRMWHVYSHGTALLPHTFAAWIARELSAASVAHAVAEKDVVIATSDALLADATSALARRDELIRALAARLAAAEQRNENAQTLARLVLQGYGYDDYHVKATADSLLDAARAATPEKE